MRKYIVEVWKQTEKPKPYSEPIDGKRAMISEGYFEKKEAVLVEDLLRWFRQREWRGISSEIIDDLKEELGRPLE